MFDPPHLTNIADNTFLNLRYGKLPEDWQPLIRRGFKECMRVLKPYGTLIFKWSDTQIPTSKVIQAIGETPLYGHRSGKKMNTHWMAFLKTP